MPDDLESKNRESGDAAAIQQPENDTLVAFQLRARLDDFKFGITYQCMQELKWTYKNGSYKSPCGSRIFESSKQVEEALDRFAVPDIENAFGRWKNTEITSSTSITINPNQQQQQALHRSLVTNRTKQDDEIDRKLREDLLTCLFTKVSATKSSRNTSKGGTSSNKRTSKRMATTQKTEQNRPKKSRKGKSSEIAVGNPVLPGKTTITGGLMHQTSSSLTDQDRYLLSTNHCLLIYGYGSKRTILHDFALNILSQDGDVIEILGYDQNVRMEEFLDVLVHQFLNGNEPEEHNHNNHRGKLQTTGRIIGPSLSGTDIGMNRKHVLVKRAKTIAETLARTRICPLYLVLHSIDGVALRSQVVQETLAALVLYSGIEQTTESTVKSSAVRLVATVDHVNATSLIQEVESWMSLNWIWKEVRTYQPYDDEVKASGIEALHKTARGSSRGAGGTGGAGGSGHEGSIQTILTSLAKRHAETLQALAGLQLKTTEEKQPVEYRDLRQECLHKMIAGQDSVLRDYLTELVDHEIVERFVDEDTATEKLRIPYSRSILQEILTFQI